MKITNKQISILAADIYNTNFKAAYEKEVKDYQKQKEDIKLTKEEIKICKDFEAVAVKLNTIFKSVEYSYDKVPVGHYSKDLLSMKKSRLKFVSKVPTVSQIESEITLATIASSDLGELMRRVKQKFNLK